MNLHYIERYITIGFMIMSLPSILLIPNLYFALIQGSEPLIMSTNMIARSLLKLYSLQTAINSGVYYGIAEVNYEIEPYPIESGYVRSLLVYSFTPAFISWYITHSMLYNIQGYAGILSNLYVYDFIDEVSTSLLDPGFGSIIFLQISMWIFDFIMSKYKVIPIWYGKFRIWTTVIQVTFTILLYIAVRNKRLKFINFVG